VCLCAQSFFEGNGTNTYGIGGSIPFLAELGKKFPAACVCSAPLCNGMKRKDSTLHRDGTRAREGKPQ
jgi:hypothetical protein